jgi:queuosine precursor transporter
MFSHSKELSPKIKWRREWVFLLMAGIFLGSLTMLNILGVTRFLEISKYLGLEPDNPFKISVAIGVLAYPITFLCTDFISEIYGKKRANLLVWIGLVLNVWVLFILWIGGVIDAPEDLKIDGTLPLDVVNGEIYIPHGYTFYEVRKLAFGATFASMLAYMAAQFCDVHIFHFLKRKTNGKHLWIRNNGSTIVSQLVDSTAVILITHFYANALPLDLEKPIYFQLFMFVLSSYLFKFFFALIDTIPFYFGVKFLRKYLQVEDEIE